MYQILIPKMDGGQPPKKRKLINQYFTKTQPLSSTATSSTEQPPAVTTATSSTQQQPAATTATSSTEQPPAATAVVTPPVVETVLTKQNDIGRVFQNALRNTELVRKLCDYEKQELLTNHWLPGDGFSYPFTQKGGKCPQKVYLNIRHMTGVNSCFRYSPSLEGLLCVPCVLFAGECSVNDRKKTTLLHQLVNKPLMKYSHLTGSGGYISEHLKTGYHQDCQAFSDAFLHSKETKSNVLHKLNDNHREAVTENRERLIPIIKTVILCARLGIAFRESWQKEATDTKTSSVLKSDGNFKALLDFRVDAGDSTLKDHLLSSGKNATYISPQTQNELISECGNYISSNIINELKETTFFSVIADETTDSAHKEQLCICLRYVSIKNEKHIIKEEFLKFETAHDLSAAGLDDKIISTLNDNDLDLTNLVGQGYDGASTMSGHVGGVNVLIKKVAPAAQYVHCGSHVLNLVLNAASSVPGIRNMFAVVKDVLNYVNDSVKRREVMENHLKKAGSTRSQLPSLCETRFIERHDALVIFQRYFSSVVDALDELSKSKDHKTADKAVSLLKSISDSSFLVSLCCAKKLMLLTQPLSKCLQTINRDLISAMNGVESVLFMLKSWRNSDEEWDSLEFGPFFVARNLCEEIGCEITKPRVVGRSVHRANVPAETPEQYFKRSVWYPYLDAIIESLRLRFSQHNILINKMMLLIPSEIQSSEWPDVMESLKLYTDILGNPDVEDLRQQFHQWKYFCAGLTKAPPPSSALEALDIVPVRLELIKKLLTIYCAIPVTSCEAERAFSAMKILKNFLRNRMGDERLSGLALMYIHPDIGIDIDEVIDRFADSKKRRLDFVL